MHWGVFHGENADNQKQRVLILGESHHISRSNRDNMEAGKPATYATASVVAEHLRKEKTHDFLTQIVCAFGWEPDKVNERFWHSVYFGNYIDVLCGIKNGVAKQMVSQNRKKYNNQLFDFVNEHKISTIFCFGVLPYQHLPGLAKNCGEYEEKKCVNEENGRKRYFRECLYMAGVEHRETDVKIKQDLQVFCVSHPASFGFKAKDYATELKEKRWINFDEEK